MPVTARDFEFTHQVRLEHPRVNESHLIVRRVRAVGAKTVEVVLRARWVDWRLLFDHVLPRHVAAGQEFESLWKDGIDNPRTRRPIGSGPFLLAGWQRGRQLRWSGIRHWGPHPAYLDRVEFRFFPPQDTADQLRRGEIDMIEISSPVMGAQALELHRQRAPGIRIDSTLGGAWEQFAIRQGPGGHPALRKRLVRQAIAYGSTAPSSPVRPQRWTSQAPRRAGRSTASSHWRRTRTTSGTGARIATGRPGRGSCSSRRAAAAEPTASTSATATGSRSASRRLRAYSDGSSR